ncbi:hypothetical protein QM012_001470 [Aureobasidium pullulans]|uniref:Uncharacterized protein n=1 Tax=Aureobasidium pullulans TaxID=5580 RepID=A0ABR0TFN2_AURPU
MSTAYPSYESLVAAGSRPIASPTFLRIRWFLRSDETSQSIFILDDPTDLDSSEEPYSSTHLICGTALTCPAVSSIIVSVDSLDEYANDWIEAHEPHASPDQFDEQGRVQRCCGEDRPGPGPRLEIVAEGGSFVTVGQFVDTVHSWLHRRDGQLRAAAGVVHAWPLDPAHDFVVRAWSSPIRVAPIKNWTPANFDWERHKQVNLATNALENMRVRGLLDDCSNVKRGRDRSLAES